MSDEFRKGWFAGYIVATILYIVITLISSLIFPSKAKAQIIETCDLIECKIALEAKKQGVPVQVAVAVAKVESRLRQSARGPFGEVGVFQIRPEFTQTNIYDLKTNIHEGVRQLAYWKQHCPSQEGITWVNCYNGGFRHPKYPSLSKYVKKVMAEL